MRDVASKRYILTTASGASIHVQALHALDSASDVLCVHGATFSSDLSVFYKLDGTSWADSLVGAGFNAWGFDFVGYGQSSRYDADSSCARGQLSEALPQLAAVVQQLRLCNGGKKICLLAHSWGTLVAARFASEHPELVSALVLFGPPVLRNEIYASRTADTDQAPSHHFLSIWAQYRRFIEDVPRGAPQVLSEADFAHWSRDWLATDPHAKSRSPESVITPYGPLVDLGALWSGKALFDANKITMHTLLIRGEWDSVCDDTDAACLLKSIGTSDKSDVKIPRATHLMHLESQRGALHNAVNQFLRRVEKEKR